MRYLSLALIAVLAISASASAQCSTLAITGTVNAGQTVTVDVSGAPADSIVFIAIGDAGATSIPLPGGSTLSLGVAQPFILLPLGVADASGHVALSASIPANIPANLIQNHTYTVQAISASFSFGPGMPSISVCASNTASLVSGTG
jgi:hypothetical protein